MGEENLAGDLPLVSGFHEDEKSVKRVPRQFSASRRAIAAVPECSMVTTRDGAATFSRITVTVHLIHAIAYPHYTNGRHVN